MCVYVKKYTNKKQSGGEHGLVWFTCPEKASHGEKHMAVERHGGGAGGWLSHFYPPRRIAVNRCGANHRPSEPAPVTHFP